MASIYRNSYTRNGQKHVLDRWYIKYKTADGSTRRVPRAVDRGETEALARELESHASRTLQNILRDYKAYLQAKGDDWRTVEQNLARIRAFNLNSLNGAAELRTLPAIRQTARHYLTTLRGYLRWAVRERIS
jgi:hypothetical protein